MQRQSFIATIAVAVVIGLAAPAAAMTSRQTGDRVDYDLAFPVAGGAPGFLDGFGEPRPDSRTHMGIDLFAPKGTDVFAAATGTVLRTNGSYEDAPAEDCCSVVILHDDGWLSIYAHLNNDTPGTDDGLGWGIAPGIVPGARVKAGDLIGWVGDSGNAEDTPPHLHFELHDPAAVIVNPYAALRSAAPGGAGPAPAAAATSAASPTTALRFGDDSDIVAKVQLHLDAVGIDSGAADGRYGPATEAAVITFQKRHGLEADGVAGRITRAALAGLVHAAEGSLLGFGRSGDEVARIQRLLSEAGIDPGPVDGSFGPTTLQAVLAFQAARAIAVDGLVGPETRAELGIE